LNLDAIQKVNQRRRQATDLKCSIKCDSKREAKNLQLSIVDLLCEDFKVKRGRIKFTMEDIND